MHQTCPFTSLQNFISVNIIFFFIQMSSSYLFKRVHFLIEKGNKTKKSVYIANQAGKHIPTRLPQSHNLENSENYLDLYCAVKGFDFFLFLMQENRDSIFISLKRFQATFPAFISQRIPCNGIYCVGFCRLRFIYFWTKKRAKIKIFAWNAYQKKSWFLYM